jgi:hypothetical protein
MGKSEFLEEKQEIENKLSLEERVLKVLEEKGVVYICHNLDKFPDFSHKEIVMVLIKSGKGNDILFHIRDDVVLDKEIAMAFIEAGLGYRVSSFLESFSGLDKDVAMALIEAGRGRYVIDNSEKFSGLVFDKKVAMAFIKAGDGHCVVTSNIFSGLDKGVLIALIEAGQGGNLKYSRKFKDFVWDKEVKIAFAKAGVADCVFLDCDSLDKDVAIEIIKAGEGKYVVAHLESFSGLDKDVLIALIEAGLGGHIMNSGKFSNFWCDKEVKIAFAKAGFFDCVYFEDGSLDKNVAIEFIKAERGDFVIEFPGKFSGLVFDKEVVMEIIKAGVGNFVIKHSEKFSGLDDEVDFYLSRGIGVSKEESVLVGFYNELKDKRVNEQNQFLWEKIKLSLDEEVLSNANLFLSKFSIDQLWELKGLYQKNFHDLLLLVPAIKSNGILQNWNSKILWQIITTAPDLSELINTLNQFSFSVWEDGIIEAVAKGMLIPEHIKGFAFKNYHELVKYWKMIGIVGIIPEGLSEDEIEAVMVMVEAPGISFDYIRDNLEDGYIQKMLKNEELDEVVLISPIQMEYPFTQYNEILASVLGNRELAKYASNIGKLLNVKVGLGNISLMELIVARDKEIKQRIIHEYALKVKKIKAKTNITEEEQEKELIVLREAEKKEQEKAKILKGNHVNLENFYQQVWDEEYFDNILKELENLSQKEVYSEKDSVNVRIYGNAFDFLEKNKKLPILEQVSKLLFTGVSGQQSANQASHIYHELKQHLVKKNINIQEYLTRQIPERDYGYIKSLLQKYGVGIVGKKLLAEIHKKTDARGWTSGDYTDCCMRYGTEKNYDYMNNRDTAYFTVSIVDDDGNRDLIAQSVLVAGKRNNDQISNDELLEKTKDFTVLALDNIEIANRGLKYRADIGKVYLDFFDKQFQDKEIILGTSYNDDGGAVSGGRPLVPMIYDHPENMEYSDCFDHSSCYLLRSAKGKEFLSEYQPLGLTSYMLLDDTPFKQDLLNLLGKDHLEKILEYLQIFNRGVEDNDGDGGMTFPNNHSAVFSRNNQYQGYILAGELFDKDKELSGEININDLWFNEGINKEEQIKNLLEWFKLRSLSGDDFVFDKDLLDKYTWLVEFLESPEIKGFKLVLRYDNGLVVLENNNEVEEDGEDGEDDEETENDEDNDNDNEDD